MYSVFEILTLAACNIPNNVLLIRDSFDSLFLMKLFTCKLSVNSSFGNIFNINPNTIPESVNQQSPNIS